jgi:hypothetical protein
VGPRCVERLSNRFRLMLKSCSRIVLWIRPSRPTENGYIRSVSGRLREERLNAELFSDLLDARAKLETGEVRHRIYVSFGGHVDTNWRDVRHQDSLKVRSLILFLEVGVPCGAPALQRNRHCHSRPRLVSPPWSSHGWQTNKTRLERSPLKTTGETLDRCAYELRHFSWLRPLTRW